MDNKQGRVMGSVKKKTAGAVGAFLIFATFEVLALPAVREAGLRGYELVWAGMLILYSLGAFLVFLEWQRRGEEAEQQIAPPPLVQRPILVEETVPPPLVQKPLAKEAPRRREIQPEEFRRRQMRVQESKTSEFEYQANMQARRRQAQLQRQHAALKRG
ncbi:MAG: hypothetical protein ACXV3U_06680 [Halobacteriota archaeon]